MRILTADIFPHTLVEEVLYANVLLFVFILLQSERNDHQSVDNDPNRNRCIHRSAMKDIINCKRCDDQCSNDKLDNTENNAVENIVSFDPVYHLRIPFI